MKNKFKIRFTKPRTIKEANQKGWFRDRWNIWVHHSNPDGDGYTRLRDIPAEIPLTIHSESAIL